MIKGLEGRIKVNDNIKPLPVGKRLTPKIELGQNYYVCFGLNNAYPCTVIEIKDELETQQIVIEIPMKPQSKNGFIDKNGERSHKWRQTNVLYTNEIGLTPEEAVKNTVMGF